MADKNKSGDGELLDHNYDGIQEYNNPLPNWWLMTFFGTIIFAAVYYFHYEMAGGPTLVDELKMAMKDLPAQTAPAANVPDGENEEALAVLMAKPEVLAKGKEVYVARCLACHADAGQGLVGPNLTDKFWINGKGTRVDIIAVVRKGVAEKGMPAWATMLPADEVLAVSAHVYALKGTSPANPKAPQGVEVP